VSHKAIITHQITLNLGTVFEANPH